MKCKRFKKVIYLFLKKELTSSEMMAAKKHLAECRECKRLCHKLDTLTAQTGRFLKSIKTEEYIRFSAIKEKLIPFEKKHSFRIPARLVVLASALLFTVISLFLITRDRIRIEKPSIEKSDHAHLKEIAYSSHQDIGKVIKPDKKIETVFMKMESAKPSDEDEFRESYQKWLDERQSIAKPTMLVVIHQNPAIREIYFLNN